MPRLPISRPRSSTATIVPNGVTRFRNGICASSRKDTSSLYATRRDMPARDGGAHKSSDLRDHRAARIRGAQEATEVDEIEQADDAPPVGREDAAGIAVAGGERGGEGRRQRIAVAQADGDIEEWRAGEGELPIQHGGDVPVRAGAGVRAAHEQVLRFVIAMDEDGLRVGGGEQRGVVAQELLERLC